MNSTQLIGRLTRDPEPFEASGTSGARLRIAFDQGADRGTGYIDVTAFGRLGEVVVEHVRKGRQVAVSGRIAYRSWQAEDGSNRSAIGIIAAQIDFLAKPAQATSDEAVGAVQGVEDDIPF
jgi:single-strand DNA-binding protein